MQILHRVLFLAEGPNKICKTIPGQLCRARFETRLLIAGDQLRRETKVNTYTTQAYEYRQNYRERKVYVCMREREKERENTQTHGHDTKERDVKENRVNGVLGKAQSRVVLVLVLLLLLLVLVLVLLGLALGPEVKAPGESHFVSLHKTFRLFRHHICREKRTTDY